jgi:hypothetical protein
MLLSLEGGGPTTQSASDGARRRTTSLFLIALELPAPKSHALARQGQH